jgi:hypothetical protein
MKKIEDKGVNYDVGVRLSSPNDLNNNINTSIMTEEIRIIKNELHCNAIRIYGENLEKLVECSNIAIKEGLKVWFSPRYIDASFEETLEYIIKCSVAAEKLRKVSSDLVFVIGNEFSLDVKGFIKGETVYERISNLSKPVSIIKNSFGLGINNDLNEFLKEAVVKARQNFKGEITYASGEWEKINWDLFDIIGLNYYRHKFNAWIYKYTVRKMVNKGKKVAITEFGCCCYKGAQKKGAWGYKIVDWYNAKPKLNKIYKRDENVQSNYIIDLLNTYTQENVYAAFVYTFVARKARYNVNPEFDLDMANFSVIKILPDESNNTNIPYLWERKKSFYELSKFYSRS